MDGWMDGWVDDWMNEWVDGWMNDSMDGLVDEFKKDALCQSLFANYSFYMNGSHYWKNIFFQFPDLW